MLVKINESLEVIRWLDLTLTPVMGMNVYGELIPPNAPLPAIRTTILASDDIRALANRSEIIASRQDVLVVITVESYSVSNLVANANLLHATLDAKSGATSTANIISCVRDHPFTQTTYENGKLFRMVGGVYRILVQAKEA